MLNDPDVKEALSDPATLQKLQGLMTGQVDPSQLENDPKLAKLFKKFQGAKH